MSCANCKYLYYIIFIISIGISLYEYTWNENTKEELVISIQFESSEPEEKLREKIVFHHLGERFSNQSLINIKAGSWKVTYKNKESTDYGGVLTIDNQQLKNEILIRVAGPGIILKGISETSKCSLSIKARGEEQEYSLGLNETFEYKLNRENAYHWIFTKTLIYVFLLNVPVFIAYLFANDRGEFNLLRIEYFVLLLIVANGIWLVCEPGFYSGDADQILKQVNGGDDVIAPAYSAFYRLFSEILGAKPYWIILLQVYSFTLFPYFIVEKILSISNEAKSKTNSTIALIVASVLLLNPIYVGSMTLLYVDYLFIATFLAYIYIYIIILNDRFRIANSLALIVLVLFIPFCRTNGFVLFPILSFFTAFLVVHKVFKTNQVWYKNLRFHLIVAFIFAGYFTTSFLVSKYYIVKRDNYYITVPIYEMVGVYSLDRERGKLEYKWLEKYMNIDRVISRYNRSNCLIPTLWTSIRFGDFNYTKVKTDHKLIRNMYFESVYKNFWSHLHIKIRHYLYTLGVGGYNNSPYFYDNLPQSSLKTTIVEELESRGLYKNRDMIKALDDIGRISRHLESGPLRFVFVSALVPILFMFFYVVLILVKCIKTRRLENQSIVMLLIALFSLFYSSSYLLASHGGFSKYQFPTYVLGVISIFVYISFWIDRKIVKN